MRVNSSKGNVYKSLFKGVACMALTTCVIGSVRDKDIIVSASSLNVASGGAVGILDTVNDLSNQTDIPNGSLNGMHIWLNLNTDVKTEISEKIETETVTSAMKEEEDVVESERLEALKIVEDTIKLENKKVEDKNNLQEKAEAERIRIEEEKRRKALLEEKRKKELEENKKKQQKQGDDRGTSLEPEVVDPNYKGTVVSVTGKDRRILERLVMGEAGGEGYLGACLVAQCIRDTMVEDNVSTVEQVRRNYGYTGSLSREPNSDVKKAVKFIFDKGGYAVKHKIHYFYAYQWCNSAWHETQQFIIQYGGHRFFDRW